MQGKGYAMQHETRIERVRADALHVDPAVQRAEEVGHVNRLSREWRDDFVGVLIGSERKDGRIYLLDGFQRLLAKTSRQGQGDYSFTVQVYTGLSLREEAEIFLAHNRGRKAVSPYAKFRVSLTAGDPVAEAVTEAVESLNLSVGPRSSPNTVGCIATLERIVGQMGKDIEHQKQELVWVLGTYQSVWGTTNEHWRTELIEGLAIFHRRYSADPNFSDDHLRRSLCRVTVIQMLASAKAKSMGSNRVSHAVAEVIQELHDRGKRNRRLVAV